ncbi:sigma-70 family RNA polymerase sigma factor [Alloalcanivorax sp. C16-2]|uniref:sigma-70 family RNA polymerase sigma factor n=1 Tax=Alloalcanivorax TaxID=3020832 RepID=UPI001934557D|nr:sigma-70 family RNA polymerase sigma factor [Alloalcanivorax marinus]MBL7251439.1 sigma-70 family RNA polymerase sigma factor [Alloalcanivorax marinus]
MSAGELTQDPLQHLYRGHHGWLRGWLCHRLGCSETAADLAQDTFVRIMQRQRQERDFTVSHPRQYLRLVANGLMVDHFRRRAVEQAYLEALAQRPEAATLALEEQQIILETLQQLDRMLDTLPAATRRAFLLSRLDGLTYPQIAERLGVSSRTVKRHMQRAFLACLDHMVGQEITP